MREASFKNIAKEYLKSNQVYELRAIRNSAAAPSTSLLLLRMLQILDRRSADKAKAAHACQDLRC
jgi:hypothetical protein